MWDFGRITKVFRIIKHHFVVSRVTGFGFSMLYLVSLFYGNFRAYPLLETEMNWDVQPGVSRKDAKLTQRPRRIININ